MTPQPLQPSEGQKALQLISEKLREFSQQIIDKPDNIFAKMLCEVWVVEKELKAASAKSPDGTLQTAEELAKRLAECEASLLLADSYIERQSKQGLLPESRKFVDAYLTSRQAAKPEEKE